MRKCPVPPWYRQHIFKFSVITKQLRWNDFLLWFCLFSTDRAVGGHLSELLVAIFVSLLEEYLFKNYPVLMIYSHHPFLFWVIGISWVFQTLAVLSMAYGYLPAAFSVSWLFSEQIHLHSMWSHFSGLFLLTFDVTSQNSWKSTPHNFSLAFHSRSFTISSDFT